MSVIHRGEDQMPRVRVHPSHLIAFVILLVCTGLFLIGVHGFYFQNLYTGPARTVAKYLPIPVATVEGDFIWYKRVSEMANLLITINEENTEEAFDSAFEAVIRQKNVEHLAEELGVVVTQNDIDGYQIDENIAPYLSTIGWSEKEYQHYVIEPLLLAQYTESALQSSYEHQYTARDELERVLVNIEIGIPFSDLAQQFSEDGSAVLGGDIGVYEKFELPTTLIAVWDLEVGQISEILDLGDSYALVKVYDDVVLDEERTAVALQIIIINKAPLSEVLVDYAKTQAVKVFVR